MKFVTCLKRKIATGVICATAVLSVGGVSNSQLAAAEPGRTGKKAERKGPLAALPSKPGPHVARIRAMKDNSWLELGAPKADPKWGPARGRSYSAPMPYAPDLGGSFLFGNGPHGAMFKGNHYGDELYFYDANAHAWICAYPGFDVTRYGEVEINKDGFESIDGGPVPIAPMVHSWSQITYDTHRRRFMCIPWNNTGGYWGHTIKTRKAFLTENKDKLNKTHASPWMWDVNRGAWERSKTKNKGGGRAFCILLYVPSLKKTMWYGKYGKTASTKYYDAATDDWTDAHHPKGPVPPFSIAYTTCLDTKRDRVYFGGGKYPVAKKGSNALWVYDLKTDTLIDPKPKGAPCGGNNEYCQNFAMMHYDSANDAVVLIRHRGKAGETGVFVYDPVKNRWTTMQTKLPKWPGNTRSGFYHPEWNAHVIHSAGDGRPNGKMYVYRYKKAKKDQGGAK